MINKAELSPCTVETTLMLIGDKWKVLILRDLRSVTKRFGELKNQSRKFAESADLKPACYGGGRTSYEKVFPRSSAEGGIYPHRPRAKYVAYP